MEERNNGVERLCAILLACVIALSGCSSLPSRLKDVPYFRPGVDVTAEAPLIKPNSHNPGAVIAACKRIFEASEVFILGLAIPPIALAFIGAVAGAIGVPLLTAAAPVANQAAIAALGGVSGVTNTLQEALRREQLTADEPRRALADIRQKWQKAVEDYYKAEVGAQATQLQTIAALCISYGAFNKFIRFESESTPPREGSRSK
jgi:hypothetical protein